MKTNKEIIKYLEKDRILSQAIEDLGATIHPELDIDIYKSLLNAIVSQQLSTKVVRIIWNRFTDLFIDQYPSAEALLKKEHRLLRSIGLSNSKITYLKNVAEFSLKNSVSFDYLQSKKNEEIMEYLTQIKGVGQWTVQMILMFPMDRPNIFPVDDLGIQKGMKRLYELDMEKKELKQKLIQISEKWHPYKSLASKYIWKLVD